MTSTRDPRPLSQRVTEWTDVPAQPVACPKPIFTRFGLDAKVPAAIAIALERARAEMGLSIYGEPTTPHVAMAASAEGGVTIAPIAIDEPFMLHSFQSACQVEFQFMASQTARPRQGMRRGDWTPILPSDLASASDMVQRVELVRQVCEIPNVLVGGAIAAAAIADDIRYLIDCGLDYACVLADACYGLQPADRVSFFDADRLVEQSLATIQASGRPEFSLCVVSATCTPERAMRWLGMGVRAVGIDGWLQSKCPPTPSRSSDGFGGFLVDVARPSDRGTEWLSDAVRDFMQELASELTFAGYRTIEELRSDV